MPCSILEPAARAGLAALLALGATAALADPYVGATVDSQASHYTLTCGTCPIDFGIDDVGHRGGPGFASAYYESAGSGWATAASATLDGPNGLPELGGHAFADLLTDSTPTTYFYETGTFSQGLQRYDYTGSLPTTYQIDFTIDGSFTLGANDAASLMSVYGGYTVYGDDYDPAGEVRGTVLATLFVGANASLAGMHPFAVGGSLSFDVQPGDTFYVWGALSATADSSHQVDGTTDALHTLSAHFERGDVSLLAVSVVPEPGAPALLAAGLAALGWLRRRRR